MSEETKDPTLVESETADSPKGEEVVADEVADNPYADKTVEDYKALEQKNKELYERAKKAEALAKAAKSAPLKTNETQSGLTREETKTIAVLYAKGYTDEEVDLAMKISKLDGVEPLKAIEDELFKAKHNARLKKEKSEQASLSPSGGTRVKAEKPVEEMTRQEHEAYAKKVIADLAKG